MCFSHLALFLFRDLAGTQQVFAACLEGKCQSISGQCIDKIAGLNLNLLTAKGVDDATDSVFFGIQTDVTDFVVFYGGGYFNTAIGKESIKFAAGFAPCGRNGWEYTDRSVIALHQHFLDGIGSAHVGFQGEGSVMGGCRWSTMK